MGMLLTQPIRRNSIWMAKMKALGVSIALGTGAMVTALLWLGRQTPSDLELSWKAFGFIPLCAFCAAPFWTLVFRNTLVGGLFTVVAPAMILGANSFLHDHWIEHGNSIFKMWFVMNGYLHQHWVHDPAAEQSSVITLLFLYCVVCCGLGYNKFKTLQVVDARSLEVGMPVRLERLLLRPFQALSAGFTWPFASLVKKELRLQQISFLGAGLFCAVAVAGSLLHRMHLVRDERDDWSSLLLIVDFLLYLPVLPLVVGAAAVAEERTWGVADWQLTLPPSALKQWCAKMLVTLSVSLVLGLVLPVVLVMAGTALFGVEHEQGLPALHALRYQLYAVFSGFDYRSGVISPLPVALAFLFCLVLVHVLLTSVAVYAASISANTARALVLAVGMLLAGGCLVMLGGVMVFHQWGLGIVFSHPLGQIRFFSQMAVVCLLGAALFILLGLLHRFAYAGYRTRGLTVRHRTIHALVLAFAVCFLSSAFLVLGGFFRW
jgi:ABC-type transport system involved in multi-copper enzyme maturation permease subunit